MSPNTCHNFFEFFNVFTDLYEIKDARGCGGHLVQVCHWADGDNEVPHSREEPCPQLVHLPRRPTNVTIKQILHPVSFVSPLLHRAPLTIWLKK